MPCSGDVEANAPQGSDLFDPVQEFLVIGDKNVSDPADATTLVGVAAGLTPLLLVPRGDGVPDFIRPDRSGFSRGGERDLFQVSVEPVAPSTLDADRLDDNDCITASAMMYEFANSGPSLTCSSATPLEAL